MGDECDYMSDDFLKTCETNDVRPGLLHNRTKQREHTLMKKKQKVDQEAKQRYLSKKELESRKLTEGLEKPIGEENKGFSMLLKMGFKPGSSLGASQSGIVEPIGINVKTDRKGFGREEALKNVRQLKKQYREQRKEESVSDFRAKMSRKQRERDCMSDLFKSAKACFRLDSEAGIVKPEEDWFWPAQCLPSTEADEDEEEKEEDEDDQIEYSVDIQLEMLTLYLRQSYCYCCWCGVKFEDDRDLSKSCPGSTRDDH